MKLTKIFAGMAAAAIATSAMAMTALQLTQARDQTMMTVFLYLAFISV